MKIFKFYFVFFSKNFDFTKYKKKFAYFCTVGRTLINSKYYTAVVRSMIILIYK